jgi:hypothetical protein
MLWQRGRLKQLWVCATSVILSPLSYNCWVQCATLDLQFLEWDKVVLMSQCYRTSPIFQITQHTLTYSPDYIDSRWSWAIVNITATGMGSRPSCLVWTPVSLHTLSPLSHNCILQCVPLELQFLEWCKVVSRCHSHHSSITFALWDGAGLYYIYK